MSRGVTPSQTVGPFFHLGLEGFGGEVVPPGTPGSVGLHGLVLDGAGAPVLDAMVEVWQAGPDGSHGSGFGRSATREAGRFSFSIAKPGAVGWPGGGLQAPHLDVSVFARGLLKRVVTRIYFPDEPRANALDPVLSAIEPARRSTLVASAEDDGTLRFDIRLQGEHETVFFVL